MSAVKSLLAASFAFGFISMVGCSDDDNDTPPDTSPPAISNLSHADNEKIIGNRTITFTADVTDDVGATVTITHNGNPVSVTPGGNTYTASITLGDRTNNTVVVSASDADNTSTETLTLNYPFLAFTNGQAASVVIGQPNLESIGYNQGLGTGPNTIGNGGGVAVIGNQLFISDNGNERVLGYYSIPTDNNADADFVIGQNNFTDNAPDFTNTTLASPSSVTYDNNHFFILNGYSDRRANHWGLVPQDNSVPADFVIGQDDFGTGVTTCARNILRSGNSIVAAGGKFIAGASNRVMIWTTIPTASGANADLVLGQQTFTNCSGNAQGAPTANTLRGSQYVWSDGTRLVVSDAGNDRVLIWNTFPTSNAQVPDLVLGQANFASAVSPTPTAISFSPGEITSNGNQLFIADKASDRVLIWDSWPTTDNQPADRVLGAKNLVGDITDLTNASLFPNADGLAVADSQLLLMDSNNSRVLVFNAP